MKRFRVRTIERAHVGSGHRPLPGTFVYQCASDYGVSDDDSREYGEEHVACSVNENGVPFFTIPKRDLEELHE